MVKKTNTGWQQSKYRRILQELNDLIIECDSNDLIVDVIGNVSLTGYSSDDLIGRHVSFLLESNSIISHLHDQSPETQGKKSQIFTSTLTRKDGNNLEVAVSISHIWEHGKPQASILTIRDLTQKLLMERKNKEMSQRIRNAEKLAYVGSLTRGLSHNLQGPLTAIIGRAQMLALKYTDETELKEIIKTARTMSSNIKSLLLKIRNEQEIMEQDLDINEILKSELKVLEANLFFKHQIKKQYRFEDGLPLIKGVYGDFSQSFANVIRNAMDAMSDSKRKKLVITTGLNNDHILVTIADTGHGIAKENLGKIFDPHFSTKGAHWNESATESSGLGLGLSSVQELLKPYDVHFKVNSKEGVGTVFQFMITFKKTVIDDYKQIKARVRIRMGQVVRKLNNLPTIPTMLYEVINASQTDISIKRLTHMVENDYALAGKIFTIVNSASYSLMRPISNLVQAVSYIGLEEVRNICYGLLSLQILSSGASKPYVQELWVHSLSTAVISREIMRHLGRPIELGYLTALLHDIGKVILLENHSQIVMDMGIAAPRNLISLREEYEMFSVTHDVVGSWFLKERTRLPESMRQAIEEHHQSPSPDVPELNKLLILSDHLAHGLEKVEEPTEESSKMAQLLWNLKAGAVQTIVNKSRQSITQVKETYRIK